MGKMHLLYSHVMEKDEAVTDYLDKKWLCLKANAQMLDESIRAYIKQLPEEYQYIVTTGDDIPMRHLLDRLKVREWELAKMSVATITLGGCEKAATSKKQSNLTPSSEWKSEPQAAQQPAPATGRAGAKQCSRRSKHPPGGSNVQEDVGTTGASPKSTHSFV